MNKNTDLKDLMELMQLLQIFSEDEEFEDDVEIIDIIESYESSVLVCQTEKAKTKTVCNNMRYTYKKYDDEIIKCFIEDVEDEVVIGLGIVELKEDPSEFAIAMGCGLAEARAKIDMYKRIEKRLEESI